MCLKPNKMEIKKNLVTHWVILAQKIAKMNPNEPTGLFWFKKQQKRTQMNPLGYLGVKNKRKRTKKKNKNIFMGCWFKGYWFKGFRLKV